MKHTNKEHNRLTDGYTEHNTKRDGVLIKQQSDERNIVRDEWMDGCESIAQRDNRQTEKETTKRRRGGKAKGIKKD
jgi:hypothetical protein